VEKATSELRNAPSTAPEELTKQHAEELRALEERLVAKYQEELNKANEAAAAAAKALESRPAPETATTAEAQKAAIDDAVAAKEAELKVKHEAAIEKALENGRLEGTMKLRLKDTQLIKAQNKVKELEARIEEWKKAGIIDSASAPPATTPSVPVPTPSASAPPPTTSAPTRGGAPGTAAAPGRKPPVASAATVNTAAGAPGQPARGRGRGAMRGNIGIRGAAVPGLGRGASAPQGSAGGATTAAAGGVSIMGAASKRTREEGEASSDDSLAKRLKPAAPSTTTTPAPTTTAAAAAEAGGNTGGKPITLQRNRVQPS